MRRDPEPELVRCAKCRETLVTPGRTCMDCHRDERRAQALAKKRAERRAERDAKFQTARLVVPRPLPAHDMAAHRRVGAGEGRRWR